MKAISSFLQVFQSRKMVALALFGFSSGLPYLLTRDTLQAWMTKDGIDLGTVVWFSLVSLPYSLKFLWAPLMDRFVPPFLGRRRGWILLTQVALILAIALMSLQSPSHALDLLAVNAIAIAFLSASQDITIDAYRTDVLAERELGAGVAVYVVGYRIALLVTGWLAFRFADRLQWPGVYLAMALLMGAGLITSLWSPEPRLEHKPPASLVDAVVKPFLEFFQRSGTRKGIYILCFIVLYKLGDSLAAIVTVPFLLKTGFTQASIGDIRGGMGLLATIVGTLAGGAVLSKIGVNRALWVFGALQALSNFAYLTLAIVGKNYPLMILTVNIENFCAGLGTAAFLGFLMSLCNPSFSATQFALLSSLMAVSRDLIVSPAGELAKITQWPVFFAITIAASLPGLMLLPYFAPWKSSPKPAIDSDIEDR